MDAGIQVVFNLLQPLRERTSPDLGSWDEWSPTPQRISTRSGGLSSTLQTRRRSRLAQSRFQFSQLEARSLTPTPAFIQERTMLHRPNPFAKLALVALAACTTAAAADTVHVTVNSSLPWIGFVNVFELPAVPGTDRGAYWQSIFVETNIAALPASVAADVATLAPNAIFGGEPMAGNPDWWTPDGFGGFTPNKVMEANVYVDTGFGGGALSGNSVNFTGMTLDSSLAAPYVAYAWIRDFSLDYSLLRNEAITPLTAGQTFDLWLDTMAGGAVQYGFALVGPNADPAMLQGLGTISIGAVPEPATPAMLLLGALVVGAWVRRQR
jgi:hypothetical protein